MQIKSDNFNVKLENRKRNLIGILIFMLFPDGLSELANQFLSN